MSDTRFFLRVIHIKANISDTQRHRSADLGNAFRHKMATNIWKKAHSLSFKTSSKSSLGNTVLHVSWVSFKKDLCLLDLACLNMEKLETIWNMVPKACSKVNKVSFKINEIEEKWSWSIKANDRQRGVMQSNSKFFIKLLASSYYIKVNQQSSKRALLNIKVCEV